MKWIRRILIGLAVILVLALIGFWSWATLGAQQPESLATNALAGGDGVDVMMVRGEGYTLLPDSPKKTGFIFYSGGLVTPEAYAAHLKPLAEAGFTVVVPNMPLNLAVFNLNAANQIVGQYPQIERWVIGGHSLGGAMAAQYALEHDDEIDGLVLWASFPAEGADLSNHNIEAVSIYASQDGLASIEEVLSSAERLPGNAMFVEISGGNHAQFGDYGEQSGDLAASIQLIQQIDQTAQITLEFLETVDSK
ncbi:MAG: alpha/beta fold hydrolase [Chloroflexota bacterium]